MTEIEIYKQIVQKQDEYNKLLRSELYDLVGYSAITKYSKYTIKIDSLRQQLAKAQESDKELAEIRGEERNCNNCRFRNLDYSSAVCDACCKYPNEWEPIK